MTNQTFLDCIGLRSVARTWKQERLYFRTVARMAHMLVNMKVPQYKEGSGDSKVLDFTQFHSCDWKELRSGSISNVATIGSISPEKDLTGGLTTLYSGKIKDHGTVYFFTEEMDPDEFIEKNPLVIFIPKAVHDFLQNEGLVQKIIDVLEQVVPRNTGDNDRDFMLILDITDTLLSSGLTPEDFKTEEMFSCYFHECKRLECNHLSSVGELHFSDPVLDHIVLYCADTNRYGRAYFLGIPEQNFDRPMEEKQKRNHLVVFLSQNLVSKITNLSLFHKAGMVA